MATNSKLNSDPVCALSFEFELKDLRCAKAALSGKPSIQRAVSGRLSNEGEQKLLEVPQ